MSNEKNPKAKVSKGRDEKADFDRWLALTFTNTNSSPTVPEWMHRQLAKVYRFDRQESFLLKFKKMRRLKKITFVDPVNYICTVLTARSLKTNVSANYGFIYSTDFKYHNEYNTDDKRTKNPVLFSYCIAPSLLSTDGEYRNRLLKWGQFELIADRFSHEMEWLEKALIHKIERYELSLECENFYPQIDHERLSEQLDHTIVQQSVLIKFFVIFWLTEIHNLSLGLQENHINPKFNQIFFPHLDDDLKEYRDLCAKFTRERIAEMVEFCTTPVFRRVTDKAYYTVPHSVGQKLRPLNVGEVQDPLNICYSPWLEIYLSGLASDLLANAICPSFAIFVDWFYIKNSKKGLFDNEQQYQKIEFSERALVITKKLRETQRITYTRDAKTDERRFLNGMFQALHDKIEDPVDFTKDHLLMSNVTLGFVTENVGRTFVDIPILNRSQEWRSVVGDVLKHDWIFRKYIWDVCYGLLSLNVKLGVTHSDLHLNNCTINNMDSAAASKDARVLYQIDGTWYNLRTHGPYACIIDFSRGTIHPEQVSKYPAWTKRDSHEDFTLRQNQSMISKLEQTIPTFMKINRDQVVELQRDSFDKFYRIYSAVDSFDFASKLAKAFGKVAQRATVLLAEKIAKISEHFLTNMLLKVIQNRDLAVDWPMLTIMRECFTDEIFDPTEPRDWDVVDMWLFDRKTNVDKGEDADKSENKNEGNLRFAPLEYSLSEFARWPPILKTEYGIAEGEKDEKNRYRIQSVAYMDQMRKDYESYRHDQMKMIRYIAKRHQEKYA